MCRFVVLMLLLALGGCRNRPTQLDPFLGKTTVPPPPTGSVGTQAPLGSQFPAAPPNWNAPPTNTLPGTTTPGTVAPGTGTPALPPGGSYTPSVPFPPPQTLSGGTAPPPNNTPYQFTGAGNSNIRVVPPDPNTRSSFGTPNGGIDIMQLPVKGQGSRPATTPPGTVTVVSNTTTTTLPVQPSSYGFDPSYSQLSGKLEYSPHDGRWLLRYVPPENRPDRYGGVAILVPSGSMAGYRSGDFVTAQGRLEAVGNASPVFTASGLSAQRATR